MKELRVIDTPSGKRWDFFGRVVIKAIIAAAIFNFICDIIRIMGWA